MCCRRRRPMSSHAAKMCKQLSARVIHIQKPWKYYEESFSARMLTWCDCGYQSMLQELCGSIYICMVACWAAARVASVTAYIAAKIMHLENSLRTCKIWLNMHIRCMNHKKKHNVGLVISGVILRFPSMHACIFRKQVFEGRFSRYNSMRHE